MERNDDEQLPARVREALDAQWAVTHALQRVNMAEWIHLELSLGQLKTLMALASLGAMNVSALAERLEVGKPAASIVVDRLVQLGYAERTEDSQDRRRTLVAPTAKGNELVRRLRQGSGGRMIARWMEQMDAGDLAALTRGLRALAAIAAEETGGSAASAACAAPEQATTGRAE
jgi:DNA-binding MarR family transcriptional regulator